MAPLRPGEFFSTGRKQHKQIIRNFNGALKSGELLIVLGRPGSGCSTFLKSICGEMHGLEMDDGSVVHYNGNYGVHAFRRCTNILRYSSKKDGERIQRRNRL